MEAPIRRSRHQEPEDGLAPSRDLAVSGAVPSSGETAKHEQREAQSRRSGVFGETGELRTLAEETITEWFNEKHRARTEAEVAFVDSIVPESCPHCGSARIRKDGFGKRAGIRAYERLDPGRGRKFGPLTGTVFDSKKIPISETIEFLCHLLQLHGSPLLALVQHARHGDGEGD